jgi:hypothetical protein
VNGRDPNAPWTVAEKLARALEFDRQGDAVMSKLAAEGSVTEAEWRHWLYARAWARKLRGQPPFTGEQATAELVGLGLPL